MNYYIASFILKNIKYLKIIVCVLLFFYYFYIISSLLTISYGWGSTGHWFSLYILGAIGFTIYFFLEDKKRISNQEERFRGLNLFFRYGSEIDRDVLPIPIKDEWSSEDSAKFGDSIIYKIQDVFLSTFGETPLNGKHHVAIIGVADSSRLNDIRGFLRISFTGSRGAIISRFVTYQILGKNLVLSKLTYKLGIIQWYDMAFYFLVSPITILFWVYSWIKQEYSVYSAMASTISNSFEIFDIDAYFYSSGEIIANVIIEELKENDLYTPEFGNIITQVFNDNSTVINNSGNNNQFFSGESSPAIGQVNNTSNGK